MTQDKLPTTAVFWDIENVQDDQVTHERLTKAVKESGDIIRAYAFADWDTRRFVAENLHQLGYDLIHVPDYRDNAADYKMAAYILEHLVRYPETKKYVMVTGDGDFKLIAGALREKGLDLWIISNPIITSSELTDIATQYSDIYSFRPITLECSTPEDCKALGMTMEEIREIAVTKLQEAVLEINESGNSPGIGHVKHVMTALNPGFNEKRLGFKNWSDFLTWAESKDYIALEGEMPGTIIKIPEDMTSQVQKHSEESTRAFKSFCSLVEQHVDEGQAPSLEILSTSLEKPDIDFQELGYTTLADFILAAEKRGFVRIISDGSEDSVEAPKIIPGMNPERVKAWFEEKVTELYGESVNVPKRGFLERISDMLLETRITLGKLENYLRDENLQKQYRAILDASDLPFLPPYQMSFLYILLGQGLSCEKAIERVNRELEPLAIVLSCPE